MKKLRMLALACFIFSGCSTAVTKSEVWQNNFGNYETKEAFLDAIEIGKAYWNHFVNAIENGWVTFKEVSPSAVANYMEAFANEGMLELIPFNYLENEEIKTAIEVVFEDSTNAARNRGIFRDHLKRANTLHLSWRTV